MHNNTAAAATNQYDPRAVQGAVRVEVGAKNDSLLEAFRQRVDQETARVYFLGGKVRELADGAFGERPEKDGAETSGPASSGRVGRMHQSLNELQRAVDALSSQLDRLQPL